MTEAVVFGTVNGIWRYPVKSLRGEALEGVQVDDRGLDGDRRRELIVETPGHARTGKAYRGKEDNRLHLLCDASDAKRAAEERGLQLEERGDGPFFDAAPVSLIAAGWLRELEQIAGRSLDVRRFRPNLFVETAGTMPAERELVGTTVAIGSTLLRVDEPIVRCVTITYDVQSGRPSPELLSLLAEHRDSVMGVYCSVVRAGAIAVGNSARAPGDPLALSKA